MKKVRTILYLLICVASLSWGQTQVIAHRGFWKTEGSAQNSLAALKKAHEIGVYGSEFDVWLTADGIPIVNHDASIFGFDIETSTYDQLMTGTLANGEKIPTVDAYLALGKQLEGMQLVLEIKSHKRVVNEDRLVRLCVELVQKYELEDRVDYIAFSMNVCKELKKLAPEATVVYLNGDVSPQDLKEIGLTGLDYNHKVLTDNPTWVAKAKGIGLTTNVWTVNEEKPMQGFIRQGIDFITTDEPELLLKVLKK
ncbi:glycerophosphodiester phosphodiesterase family protein [Parabacteroides sp. PF5-6]|uniref:glycerophosphodiester phosphodiesterase n=1 Tax=Parabacteroides sp. PF5-6 TaxID=1742403 RepID=UPI002405406B|nr:glycerophosphodiester phosphodiesterase family protein [Parabacteroides sp. PF5-6]MDF9829307.1 glycerophosphoryl diester phosphodiesterase [Parabacteroides sp. PF5-6]